LINSDTPSSQVRGIRLSALLYICSNAIVINNL
jgi:hypothetical protein